MINAKTTDIPIPVTRTEHFMYSAITGNESGLKADTQAEMYLDAIKNGDTSDLEGLEPRTVLDMYLEARQTGVVGDLPKPRTTSEMLLYQAITGEDLGAKPVSNMDKYLSLLEPNNYDARLEIESESSTIKLTDSKDGVVEVKELEGNTLVNIAPKPSKVAGDGNINDRVIISDNVVELTLESGFYTGVNFTQNSGLIKPNTTYTLIANVIENTMTQGIFSIMEANDNTIFNGISLPLGYKGIYVATTTTRSSGTLFRIQSMSGTTCKTGEKIKFSLMVLEGDFTNKPIPAEYFEGMKSVGECEDNKLEIVSQNKNLFDIDNVEITENTGLFIRKDNGYFTSKLEAYSPIRFKLKKLKKNTNYIISVKSENFIGNGLLLQVSRYDFPDRESSTVDVSSYNKNTLNFNSDKYEELTFTIYTNSNTPLADVYVYDIQIEEGSIATSYIPHSNNKKEITLSEPLRGLPNGVRDRIVLKDGKLMIERNVVGLILNGNSNEDWLFEGKGTSPNYKFNNTYRAGVKLPNSVNLSWGVITNSDCSNYFVSDKFTSKRITETNFNEDVEHFSFWDLGRAVIGINQSKLTEESESAFRQYLQTNPIKVVYRLAEPTYEEITPELQKLILKCYDNATLHFNTNIPPKSLISYTANTSNIYRYLDTLKLSKEECDSIINSMERV